MSTQLWTDEVARPLISLAMTAIGHIIPTGGAGSLGSPALQIGIRIISRARATIPAIPARYDGSLKICGLAHLGANCSPAQTSPSSASPAMSPEAVRTPAFSTRAL